MQIILQSLVSVFQVEWGVELSIPTGLLLIMLAVNLLPSFHLGKPLVEVESVLVFFVVFHNLLTASSIAYEVRHPLSYPLNFPTLLSSNRGKSFTGWHSITSP